MHGFRGAFSIFSWLIGIVLAILCLRKASRAETTRARVGWRIASPVALLFGGALVFTAIAIPVAVLLVALVLAMLPRGR